MTITKINQVHLCDLCVTEIYEIYLFSFSGYEDLPGPEDPRGGETRG